MVVKQEMKVFVLIRKGEVSLYLNRVFYTFSKSSNIYKLSIHMSHVSHRHSKGALSRGLADLKDRL